MVAAGDDFRHDGDHDPDGPDHDRRACGAPHLTARQLDVLGAIAAHHAVKEAAHALTISVNTAKTHLKDMKRLFGVSKNAELISAAIARQILNGAVFPPSLTGRACLRADTPGPSGEAIP
jgi:DNA-binding CsgD family transcriptional regulator